MKLLNQIFLKYSHNLLKEIDQSRHNPMLYQHQWFNYLISKKQPRPTAKVPNIR